MSTQQVDLNTVAVWRWQACGAALFLLIPAFAFMSRAAAPFAVGTLVAYIAVAACCIWLLPPAYYRALQFGIDAHGITIERGIWWRSHIALPRVRVQHSDVSQGPLQRRYGVATLKLYTAGSRYTKIELPGLGHHDAIALRDALLASGGDGGV
jgi:uncharacterized protein